MTKLQMSPYLRAYRQAIQGALRQVLQQDHVGGVRQGEQVEVPFSHTDLLPPPCIMVVSLEDYNGGEGDFIGIVVFHDFGIHRLHVTVLDEAGRRIEGGDAIRCPDDPEIWAYLPAVRLSPGRTVTVQVAAMDRLRGVGLCQETKTMGELC
jgi:hypothetical protein